MSDRMSPTDPLSGYFGLRERVSREAARLFTRYADQLRCRRGCYYCCDPITVLPIEIEAVRRRLDEVGFPPPERLGGPDEDAGGTPETIAAAEDRRSRDRSADGLFAAPTVRPDDRRHTAAPRVRAHDRCAFLGRAGECTVYEARPIICRTHGLPLAYRVYEYDAQGRELRRDDPEYLDLWCDLNFRTLNDADAPATFDANGRINMDLVNREIERLNDAFLATRAGGRYRDLPPGEDRLPLGTLLR